MTDKKVDKININDIMIVLLIGFSIGLYTVTFVGKENITTPVFILQLIATFGLISMYNYYCFKKKMSKHLKELKTGLDNIEKSNSNIKPIFDTLDQLKKEFNNEKK